VPHVPLGESRKGVFERSIWYTTVPRYQDSDSPSPPAGAMPPCTMELRRGLRPASLRSLDDRPMTDAHDQHQQCLRRQEQSVPRARS
jgi:hypothetical protein